MDSVSWYALVGPACRRFTARGWRVVLLSLLVAVIGAVGEITAPAPVAGATPISGSTAGEVDGPAVSGVVYDLLTSRPVAGATVTLDELDLSMTTGTDGSFRFTGFAAGTYTLSAHLDGPCGFVTISEVEILAPVVVELTPLPPRDAFGYQCDPEPGTPFVPVGGSALALTGDDALAQVNLPFEFQFYGQPQTSVWVDTNGLLAFENPGQSYRGSEEEIPSPAGPNALIAAYWADLVVDSHASVRTEFTGRAPLRTLSIEWRNVRLKGHPNARLSVQATLIEPGHILLNYTSLDTALERGRRAVVGIESYDGQVGIQYAYKQAVLDDDNMIALVYPDLSNPVLGEVTDR